MNIHEYQGKNISFYGRSRSRRTSCIYSEEAVEKAKELDTEIYVVKAQIHAG